MKTHPKIMFYHDGRHPHMYRYEPPMSKDEMIAMIDELVSTSVDAVVYCLGEGRTMLHDTQVGELLGHNVDEWDHTAFRRVHQNAVSLINEGHDPLKLICARAHEKNLLFYANLIVNAGGPDSVPMRCSDFRKNNTHLEIGASGNVDESFKGYDYLDFQHNEARDERFALIEETITKYPIDGFELNLFSAPWFFQPEKAYESRQIMTDWISKIYEITKQGNSNKELVVRIPNNIDRCLSLGFDPEKWVDLGIVDALVGQIEEYIINPANELRSLVEITSESKCRVYAALGLDVNTDRLKTASASITRAIASNYWDQGIDGLYLTQWFAEWPYSPEFYDKLRDLPHRDIMDYKDKFYYIPKYSKAHFSSSPEISTQKDQKVNNFLPVTLNTSNTKKFILPVADNLEKWEQQERVHDVLLRIRIQDITELNEFEFKINNKKLPFSLCRKINQLYVMPGSAPRDRVMGGYWFIFHLTSEYWPVKGNNEIDITLLNRESDLSDKIICKVIDIELETKYLKGKNFHREFSDLELGPHEFRGS